MERAALSFSVVSTRSPSHRPVAPVFLDESGRRWRRVRAAGLGIGIVSSIAGGMVVLSLLVPPLIPRLVTNPVKLNVTPRIATSKAERAQMEKKLELWFALERQHAPPSLRPSQLPVEKHPPIKSPRKPGDPIIAGFYVNWDDNSTASLHDHADDLDWVVCEWAFVAPGGDSLRMKIDRRVQYTINQVVADPAQRPSVFLMVSNYDQLTHRWDPASLRHLLVDRAARQRAIGQLTDSVTHYGLAGVTIDFEEVPAELTGDVVAFTRSLTASLAPRGRRVTQAVSFNDTDDQLQRYAEANDHVFLMLYDEHYGKGDPGPVASQNWYVEKAKRMLRFIPADKAILAVGAYGYDWNDGDSLSNGQTLTFQEMMSAMRNAPIKSFHFDPITLNPYARWTDTDSTDHVAWYLDAITAYDQIVAGEQLGVAGHAIWRLGSEDPAIWRVVGRKGIDAPASELGVIPPGYDPEALPRDGKGEILRIVSRPTEGRREIAYDSASRLVVNEKVVSYATPYVYQRFGNGIRAPRRAHLRRRPRRPLDRRDPRHAQVAQRARHLLRDRAERGGAHPAAAPRVGGRARDRQSHLHAPEPLLHQHAADQAAARRHRTAHRGDAQPPHRLLPPAVLRRRRAHHRRRTRSRSRSRATAAISPSACISTAKTGARPACR